jgi:membrane protein
MKLSTHQAWSLVTKTFGSWLSDYAPSMGAALAFYTLFSVAPLLMIVIAVAGYFFGADAARGEIYDQLAGLMGRNGAHAIEGLIASANNASRRSFFAGIGIVVFLIGATSVFTELQNSLNRIWRVQRTAHTAHFFALVRTRLLSFGMILAIAFLLMVSLLVSAAPASAEWALIAQVLNVVLSFALIAVLFAMIYKIIPQITVHWEDVWIGAATTSMLFTLGKQLIGIYLGRSGTVSAFGALGSLAVFLLWVYYSAQIFLLGAEFTHIYSGVRTHQRTTQEPPSPALANARPLAKSR